MPIKLGNTNISTIYKGTTPISAIYKGTTLLYQSASWELYSKVYFYNELVPTTINGKNVLNKAKIVKVSGNGVVVNQLNEYGDMQSVDGYYGISSATTDTTMSLSDGEITFTMNVNGSGLRIVSRVKIQIIANHKYLVVSFVKSSVALSGIGQRVGTATVSSLNNLPANTWTLYSSILSSSVNDLNQSTWYFRTTSNLSVGDTIKMRNAMVIDLTLMFGTGNEPTTLTDNRIQNILNRGYIPYNLGKYKESDIGVVSSTSKNVFTFDAEKYGEQNITISGTANDMIFTSTGDYGRVGYKVSGLQSGKTYSVNATIIKSGTARSNIQVNQTLAWGGTLFFNTTVNGTHQVTGTFVAESDTVYFGFYVSVGQFGNDVLEVKDFIIQDNSITDKSYTPYKTFTPITFKTQLGGAINSHNTFENGDSYVFTRNVWKVDLGTLDYQYRSDNASNLRFVSITLSTMNKLTKPTQPNLLCESGYTSVSGNYFDNNGSVDKLIRIDDDLGRFVLRNLAYTNATTFKSSLSGTYAYYPLATPQVITIPRKHLCRVDLGSLTYSYSYTDVCSASLSGIKPSTNWSSVANIYCSKYISSYADNLAHHNIDKAVAITPKGDIWIRDTQFASLTDFKNAMAGQYLFYETEDEVADITDTIDIESGGTITSNWFSWVENQLSPQSNNGAMTGLTITRDGGTFTINGTTSSAGHYIDNQIAFTSGHKYFVYAIFKNYSQNNGYAGMQVYGTNIVNSQIVSSQISSNGISGFFATATGTGNVTYRFRSEPNVTFTNTQVTPMIIDLTLAFGSGNEPSSINDPRIQEIIRLGYIPTNTTGTYKEVSPSVLPNVELSVKCK